VCLLSALSSVGTKSARQMEHGFVSISAVDEVSQGHLLVAGQLVPHSSAGEEVEVERRGQEVSDELTAQLLIHRNGV